MLPDGTVFITSKQFLTVTVTRSRYNYRLYLVMSSKHSTRWSFWVGIVYELSIKPNNCLKNACGNQEIFKTETTDSKNLPVISDVLETWDNYFMTVRNCWSLFVSKTHRNALRCTFACSTSSLLGTCNCKTWITELLNFNETACGIIMVLLRFRIMYCIISCT